MTCETCKGRGFQHRAKVVYDNRGRPMGVHHTTEPCPSCTLAGYAQRKRAGNETEEKEKE